MIEWLDAYFYFIVYSMAGWLCEDVYVGIGKKKFVNRGFLYGPYCPIYGFGALIVLYPLMMLGDHPLLVFLGGMLLTSTLEYFTSWLMEKLFHEKWWDYSHYKFNINGRVCLLNSTLFGIMSLVVVFGIQPHVEAWARSIPLQAMEIFLAAFSLCFAADLCATCVHLIKRRNVLQKMHTQIETMRRQFEADTTARRLDMEAQFAELGDRIGEWADTRPDLASLFEEFNANMEKIQKIGSQRLSKAFPARKVTGVFAPSHDLAKKIRTRLADVLNSEEEQ